MIPKTIHYCWFGNNPKPESVKRCINSWKKFCPDYKIIEWNESNFNVNINSYCKQAYDSKKWAFATDFARLWIIYHHGGVYLDTDVELIKSIDPLLRHNCFIGRQPGYQVNTGAGFGATKGHHLIEIMLNDYNDIPFIKENGEFDLWTCPHRNSQWLFDNGLRHDNSYQEILDAAIYPIEYFSPLDAYSRNLNITNNTYSIHHCDASWNPLDTRFSKFKRHFVFNAKEIVHTIVHIPNRIIKFCIGKNNYNKLKTFFKKDATK